MCAFTPLQEAAGAQRLSDSFACSKLSFGRQLGLIEWESGGCLWLLHGSPVLSSTQLQVFPSRWVPAGPPGIKCWIIQFRTMSERPALCSI